MSNIKLTALGLISFLMALLFLALPAQAENWVETTVSGGPQTFYDSDSAFVDYATGLAVVKQAAWAAVYAEYLYVLYAYDCSDWNYYTLGILEPEGWKYDYYGEMGVNSITNPRSTTWIISRSICANYNNLPSGNIPFDFKLSNY